MSLASERRRSQRLPAEGSVGSGSGGVPVRGGNELRCSALSVRVGSEDELCTVVQ